MKESTAKFQIIEGRGPLVEPLPFSGVEYERRLGALRKLMGYNDVATYVSFSPENIYYITGHDTPGYYFLQACIINMDAKPVNVLRRIETTNTLHRSWNRQCVSYEDRDDPVEAILHVLAQSGLAGKRVGLEADGFFITPRQYRSLAESIRASGNSIAELQLIESLRVVKSPEELNYIRQAATVVEQAMAAAIGASRAGVSEDVIAGEMLRTLVGAGGEYAGLPPFVKSGTRTSLCHATWGSRILEQGDCLAFELPGVRKRYAAPLFRCGTVGPPPDEVRRLADACISSLEKVIAAIRPGATSQDVHEVSRQNFAEHGFGHLLAHRTGYSVGINYPPDWGEGQIMSIWSNDTRPLQAGMTFHLVPGITIHQKYEVTISETVAVTDSGCEVITKFDRGLFMV